MSKIPPIKMALGLGLMLLLLPKTGFGSIVRLNMRCSEDSLTVSEAIERVEWSAKCSHITADDRNDALYTGEGNKRRARPMYPLYAKLDLSEMWKAPVDRNAPCHLPDGFHVMAFCTASCYEPDQELLFPQGFVAIKTARDVFLPEIITLDDKSSLSDIRLKTSKVASYTEEVRDALHEILVFEMKSGGELKVTKNHPLVDATGRMREASTFKVGEALVDFENGEDPIVSIREKPYFGKVYNVTPASEELNHNIVIAQGYLNGSAYYQNEGADFLNRMILRQTIPAELLQ